MVLTDCPGDSVINTGDTEDTGSVPGSGRSPGGGKQPTPPILAWGILRTEEPGQLQFRGSHKSSKCLFHHQVLPIFFKLKYS